MHDGHRCHRKSVCVFFNLSQRTTCDLEVLTQDSQLRLFDQCFAFSFMSLEVKSILYSVFPGVCCALQLRLVSRTLRCNA